MAVSPAKLSSSGTIDTGNKNGHITNHPLNEKRKDLKTTFLSRSVFHRLDKGGLDAEVLGYVKRGTQDPTKGGRGGRATLTALAVPFFFFLEVPEAWKAEARRGCSPSSKPFRWFWGPVDRECKWGVR